MDKNSVSLAGEFAVLSQLALHEIDANMTLGKTKGVDIIGYCDNGKMFKLEVKTRIENNKPKFSELFGKFNCSWPMNAKQENKVSDDLFYCFVKIENEKFRFFVIPSRAVAKYVKAQNDYWLKADKRHKSTPIRRFLLGLKGEKYTISTLIEEDFENKWEFLK